MKERRNEKPSVLGLGGPPTGSELSKWRPSKAGEAQGPPSAWQREKAASEQHASAQSRSAVERESGAAPEANMPREAGASTPANAEMLWRPSEAVKERLSSLMPVRGRRRFALPRSVRFVASAVLFAIGIYVFAKLWALPTETDLHPALAIFGAALVLLLIAAIVGVVSRRRRAREDENSTLRL